MKSNRFILVIIVIAQFLCTSLWFAANAAIEDLMGAFELPADYLSSVTIAVQLGFIVGTLLFAISSLADTYCPSKVFFFSAILGSLSNSMVLFCDGSLEIILSLRFLTGFFLAGIYPVGMKIAADYFTTTLSSSLGWLVGALVLGTSLPFFINYMGVDMFWPYVFIFTSLLAVMGGLLVLLFVPTGPNCHKSGGFDIMSCTRAFSIRSFRTAAMGYFGHMWELYAFWTFIPLLLSRLEIQQLAKTNDADLWIFLIIAVGAIGCVTAGYLSKTMSSIHIARWSVWISGFCCLLVPLCIYLDLDTIALVLMLLWGASVVADSPLFSSLVAQNCPTQLKATSLTIVNCIGFTITIISIQAVSYMWESTQNIFVFSILALGPLVALIVTRDKKVLLKS